MNAPLRRLIAVAAVAAALPIGLAACGDDDDRPTGDDWEPTWLSTQAIVPTDEEIVAEREDVCGPALGELRASREELLPSPSPAIDELVTEWLAEAEGLALDCPTDADERGAYLGDLDQLGAQITSALEVADG